MNLKGNKTTPKSLQTLIQNLIYGKSLKKLVLSELGFDENCMKDLIKVLKKSNIQSIDLS